MGSKRFERLWATIVRISYPGTAMCPVASRIQERQIRLAGNFPQFSVPYVSCLLFRGSGWSDGSCSSASFFMVTVDKELETDCETAWRIFPG